MHLRIYLYVFKNTNRESLAWRGSWPSDLPALRAPSGEGRGRTGRGAEPYADSGMPEAPYSRFDDACCKRLIHRSWTTQHIKTTTPLRPCPAGQAEKGKYKVSTYVLFSTRDART